MTIQLCDGSKITANKMTLNELAVAYIAMEYKYKQSGLLDLAEKAYRNAEIIHDTLEITGYYNFDK